MQHNKFGSFFSLIKVPAALPVLSAYLAFPETENACAVLTAAQRKGSPSTSSPRQRCLLQPDRQSIERDVWPINSDRSPFLQDYLPRRTRMVRRGCSLRKHFCLFPFTLNALLTCSLQLLIFGCGPWTDTELCRRVRSFLWLEESV